jgi:hypothetical protein
MALKDCVRARASGKNRSHVYRKSKLTMALKGSFILPTAKTMIIATVSPSSKDTEHSLNTLRHACIMDLNEGATAKRRGSSNQRGSNSQRGKPRGNNPRGNNPRGKQQRNGMPSGSGSSEHNTGGTSRRNSTVNSWTENIGEINVGREARILKSQKGNGAQLQSNGNDGFQKDQHQQALTGKEIRRQRISAEKRSLALLTVGQKKLLGQGRRSLGANSSTFAQSHRLQRTMSPYPQSAQIGRAHV